MADAILTPLTYDCGVTVFHHGERGTDLDPIHPEACLCGQYLNYMACPDLFGEWADLTLTGRTARSDT